MKLARMLWIDDIVFFVWGFWYPSFLLFQRIDKKVDISAPLMHMCSAVAVFLVFDFLDYVVPLLSLVARGVLLYYMIQNRFLGSRVIYGQLQNLLARSNIGKRRSV